MDALGVQPNASAQQIQDAYFDRRNELLQLLSEIDRGDSSFSTSTTQTRRHQIERQIGAVVMAVRILGDPELRMQYDDMRHERLTRKVHNNNNIHNTSISTTDATWISPSEEYYVDRTQPTSLHHHRRRPKPVQTNTTTTTTTTTRRVVSPEPVRTTTPKPMTTTNFPDSDSVLSKILRGEDEDDEDMPTATETVVGKSLITEGEDHRHQSHQTMTTTTITNDDDDDDEGTLYTTDFYYDNETLASHILPSEPPKGFVDRCRLEILGAIDDTQRSVQQVLNAFTLQEEDIRAVMSRIDKAKRQIEQQTFSTKNSNHHHHHHYSSAGTTASSTKSDPTLKKKHPTTATASSKRRGTHSTTTSTKTTSPSGMRKFFAKRN
jgi:hypothetical protein